MLKPFLKNILYRINGSARLNTLLRLSKQNLFLPFYHIISDQSIPHVEELYDIRSIETFKKDLSFLTQHYSSISAQELQEHIKKAKPFEKPSFHLTFDDGLKEMITIVAPLLKENGIHATFFINSAFVDNKDLFYRYKVSLLIHHLKNKSISAPTQKEIYNLFATIGIQTGDIKTRLLAVNYSNKAVLNDVATLVGFDFSDYLKTQQPYLTTEDIHQLKQMNFTIGAHSVDHPHYKDLTLQQQLNQTKASLDFVKNKFNLPYSYFSFPFSDEKVSKAFFEELYAAENPVTDLSFGISGLKKDIYPNHLHRFPMEGNQLSAEQLIKTEYLYYLVKSLINKNTIKRND